MLKTHLFKIKHLCVEMGSSQAADEIESLRQQLAECQAREKVLRDAINSEVQYQHENYDLFNAELDDALSMPSDSTALGILLKQAKREALLDAAKEMERGSGESPYQLQRMAAELK